jgi:hypothetical protein
MDGDTLEERLFNREMFRPGDPRREHPREWHQIIVDGIVPENKLRHYAIFMNKELEANLGPAYEEVRFWEDILLRPQTLALPLTQDR